MTQIKTTKIPRRQKCVDKDHPYIGGSVDVIDDALGKPQSQVNQERISEEANLDSKIATEKTRAEGVEVSLNTRLQTVEALAEISIGGGDIGIGTAADFESDNPEDLAKVPTIGAVLGSMDDAPTYRSNNLTKSGGVHDFVLKTSSFKKITDESYFNASGKFIRIATNFVRGKAYRIKMTSPIALISNLLTITADSISTNEHLVVKDWIVRDFTTQEIDAVFVATQDATYVEVYYDNANANDGKNATLASYEVLSYDDILAEKNRAELREFEIEGEIDKISEETIEIGYDFVQNGIITSNTIGQQITFGSAGSDYRCVGRIDLEYDENLKIINVWPYSTSYYDVVITDENNIVLKGFNKFSPDPINIDIDIISINSAKYVYFVYGRTSEEELLPHIIQDNPYYILNASKKAFSFSYPTYVFDVNGMNAYRREYATCIYPDSLVLEDAKVRIDNSKRKIMKWGHSNIAELAFHDFNYGLTGDGYKEYHLTTKCIYVPKSVASNKKVRLLCIGDSLTDNRLSYNGAYKGGWGWSSVIQELSIKDKCEFPDIDVMTIGTRNNYSQNLHYKDNNYTVRSFNEGRSGWTLAGYMNYPCYVRPDSNATSVDQQNYIAYIGMYYMAGLATKTPNYTGSSPLQEWTDCPDVQAMTISQRSAFIKMLCETPVGRYKPDYCESLWIAMKTRDSETFSGDYDASTSDAIMENYFFNQQNGLFIHPENPFYDYDKAKEWNNGTPVNSLAFSIEKYIERYKTIDVNGNRLVVSSTAGTEVNNVDDYDVCTPSHIIICLGVNDVWVDAQTVAEWIVALMSECKIDNSIQIGAWVARDNYVLNPEDWDDFGMYNTGNAVSFEYRFMKNKLLKDLCGNVNLPRQYNYIPCFYTQSPAPDMSYKMAENADMRFADLAISGNDILHLSLYAHYSIASECLGWLYYTLT